MTPTRLALLLTPALPLAPLLLAVAACGDSNHEAASKREASPPPFGLELAVAGTTGSDRTTAADTPLEAAPLTER